MFYCSTNALKRTTGCSEYYPGFRIELWIVEELSTWILYTWSFGIWNYTTKHTKWYELIRNNQHLDGFESKIWHPCFEPHWVCQGQFRKCTPQQHPSPHPISRSCWWIVGDCCISTLDTTRAKRKVAPRCTPCPTSAMDCASTPSVASCSCREISRGMLRMNLRGETHLTPTIISGNVD